MDFILPATAVQQILQYMKQYEIKWNDKLEQQGPAEIQMVKWEKPELGWCKVNTDGATFDSGLAGCGGVIRGDQGEWIRGSSCKLGPCNAKMAEV